jgi:hypothetical protein
VRFAVLAGLAAVTLAVAIYVLMGTREAEPIAQAPAAKPAEAPTPEPEPGPVPHRIVPAVAPEAEPETEDEPPTPAPVERPFEPPTNEAPPESLDIKLRQVPRRLMDAAAPCAAGQPDGDGSIDVNYTVVVAGGQIQVEEVQMLDSSLSDSALERCITGKLADTSWEDDGFPDSRTPGRMTITRHDLARRQ